MKRTPEYYVKFIQHYLNEISMCGPEQGAYVLRLQKKAARQLELLKFYYPDIESPRPEGERGATSSDAGI